MFKNFVFNTKFFQEHFGNFEFKTVTFIKGKYIISQGVDIWKHFFVVFEVSNRKCFLACGGLFIILIANDEL